MAKYRYVQTIFWDDVEMLEKSPEDKYFYLFLLTNPRTTQCGIYEISIKQMEYYTGYNQETIKELIDRWENGYKKIKYNKDTKEIVIKNWLKFNDSNSPKVKTCIIRELLKVKDKTLIKELTDINKVYLDYINNTDNKDNKDKIKKLFSDFLERNKK